MSLITNYWPDPRFTQTAKLGLHGCTISSVTNDFNPDNSTFPGFNLTATTDWDNWAEFNLTTIPAGMSVIVACKSGGVGGNDGTPGANASVNVWSLPDNACLASCPVNGGVSQSFTIPEKGVKICFRAPKTKGAVRYVADLFIGTKNDYEQLLKSVPSGFLAGDLMPQQN